MTCQVVSCSPDSLSVFGCSSALCLCARRLIAAAHEGLAAKQRLLDEYTGSNRSAQLQETTAQLDGFRQSRDAAAVVSDPPQCRFFFGLEGNTASSALSHTDSLDA